MKKYILILLGLVVLNSYAQVFTQKINTKKAEEIIKLPNKTTIEFKGLKVVA